MTDLTALTPAEIDTMWGPLAWATSKAAAAVREIEAAIRRNERRYGEKPDGYVLGKLSAAKTALAAAKAAEEPYQAEWTRRDGWTRLVLCDSNGGHYHRERCHTLTPGLTFVSFVPVLSGADEAEIVAACGSDACTHCFPSAPVGGDLGARATQRIKLARAAVAAAGEIAWQQALIDSMAPILDMIDSGDWAAADLACSPWDAWRDGGRQGDEPLPIYRGVLYCMPRVIDKASGKKARTRVAKAIRACEVAQGKAQVAVDAADAARIDWRTWQEGLVPSLI